MKGFLIGVAILACGLLLARWQPPETSLKRIYRDSGLLLIGTTLTTVSLTFLLRAIGLGEYAAGDSLIFVVVGLGYTIGSATKASTFWNVHSNWWLWSRLSGKWQQVLGIVLGLLLLAAGIGGGTQERTAYRICRSWYAMARSPEDSARVAGAAPDPRLRPPRGRPDDDPRPPMTCSRIVR